MMIGEGGWKTTSSHKIDHSGWGQDGKQMKDIYTECKK